MKLFLYPIPDGAKMVTFSQWSKPTSELTERETEVAELVCEEVSNDQARGENARAVWIEVR